MRRTDGVRKAVALLYGLRDDIPHDLQCSFREMVESATIAIEPGADAAALERSRDAARQFHEMLGEQSSSGVFDPPQGDAGSDSDATVVGDSERLTLGQGTRGGGGSVSNTGVTALAILPNVGKEGRGP